MAQEFQPWKTLELGSSLPLSSHSLSEQENRFEPWTKR